MTSEKSVMAELVAAVLESNDRTIGHLVRGDVALAYEEVLALRELQLRIFDILIGEMVGGN